MSAYYRFTYHQLEIEGVRRINSDDPKNHLLIIGDNTEEEEHMYAITFDKRFFRTQSGTYRLPREVSGMIAERVITEYGYLYLGIAEYGDKFQFLIEPKAFESITEEEMDRRIETSLAIGDFDFLKDELDLLYMHQPFYYEVTGGDAAAVPKILIEEELELFLLGEPDLEYITHHEPLTYRFGEDQLILITAEDLAKEKVRILEVSEEGLLTQLYHLEENNILELLKDNNYTLWHFMEMEDILMKLNNHRRF